MGFVLKYADRHLVEEIIEKMDALVIAYRTIEDKQYSIPILENGKTNIKSVAEINAYIPHYALELRSEG